MFGLFWERFWALLEFWKFFDFLKTFRRLDPPWNTGQKNFSKELPQNMFKTRLDAFGNDFGRLLNFEKFSKTFRRLDPPWNTGQNKFSKKFPQNMLKTRLDKLGTILGIFGILQIFWFFETISKTRPYMEHWAKKISEKITPKHVQNTFGRFWERFWASFEFWKIFKNVSQTRPSMEHWAK